MATKLIHHFAEGENPTLDWTEEVEVDDEEPVIDPLDGVRAKVAKVTNAATRDALTAVLDALS